MIRKARVGDIKRIHSLINHFADKGEMLPRSINQLYEGIRDFFVFEQNSQVVACAALHITWEDLAEIRSVAVSEQYRGKGLGTELVNACIEEAKQFDVTRIFVLTNKPGYFKKFQFEEVPKETLPHKIWHECINCPKFPDCDEIPLLRIIK
jgi:amino-acid N-acetyltransferase